MCPIWTTCKAYVKAIFQDNAVQPRSGAVDPRREPKNRRERFITLRQIWEVRHTKPQRHYDKVAKNYSKMITQGIGGILKRYEAESLIRLLSPHVGEAILDAGCGSGFYAKMIKRTGANVFCVDISPKMVEVVRQAGLEAETHDIQFMNLNRAFDKILCAGPLEFCQQPRTALRNLRRHLKKQGYVVVSVLTVSLIGVAYLVYHISHGFRINLFTLRRIVSLLHEAGFRVETIEKPTSFLYVIKARPI